MHDPDALSAVLLPYRVKGLRLAIAGAGYARLRHVLAVRPDLIKTDMALTRGADVDLARQTLLRALASFGHATGCRLVAEGAETLASCGRSRPVGSTWRRATR